MELVIKLVELFTALAGLAAAVATLVPVARSWLRSKGKGDRKR